ncbi:hypothetical protein TNCV_3149921 [Trichonephila clavipes]|nr:hypothetical protein TNCV_3149921 [Trichonephila clavipes]
MRIYRLPWTTICNDNGRDDGRAALRTGKGSQENLDLLDGSRSRPTLVRFKRRWEATLRTGKSIDLTHQFPCSDVFLRSCSCFRRAMRSRNGRKRSTPPR